jgi:hypothetical protein
MHNETAKDMFYFTKESQDHFFRKYGGDFQETPLHLNDSQKKTILEHGLTQYSFRQLDNSPKVKDTRQVHHTPSLLQLSAENKLSVYRALP